MMRTAARPDSPPPLRFGLILPAGPIQAWQERCIRSLLRVDGVELVLLVEDQGSDQPRRHSALFDVYTGRLSRPRALRVCKQSDLLRDVPRLECESRRERNSRIFSRAEVERIREYSPHFILDLCSDNVAGTILTAAPYGVWCFRCGNPPEGVSEFAGFWEIDRSDSVTSGVLVRLTGADEADIELQCGHLETINHSYGANADSLLFRMAGWPAGICAGLVAGRSDRLSGPAAPPSRSASSLPTNRTMLHYFCVVFWNLVTRVCTLLFRFSAWNIGIAQCPIQAFLDPGANVTIDWLPESPDGTFRADPFALAGERDLHVLYEEYDYKTTTRSSTNSKGVISFLTLRGNRTVGTGHRVLELPVHISYPYLLRHEGEIYCLPETSEAREVALYRATNFPHDWQRERTLLEGIAALDSTVFPYAGRWWLMCTDHHAGSLDTLLLFHAPELFGPWSAHVRNPVKIDARSARPAGTPFMHQGRLYRPAQDCSGRYGGRITITRIEELSPSSFREEVVGTVEPDSAGPYPHGIHTLSDAGAFTLVDGRRLIFAPRAFLHRLSKLGETYLRRVRPARAPARTETAGSRSATA